MIRNPRRSEEGYVMVTALIALAVMALLAAAAISQANSALRMSSQAVRSEQALYMANAGVEMILAKTRTASLIEENEPYTYTLELEPGLTGAYSVIVTVPRPGIIQIHATGTASRDGQVSSRVVEAEIPFQQGDEDDSDEGSSPDQVSFGNGSLNLMNGADICGDLYANGNITLGNSVTVWAKTKEEDQHSPCDSILGTGKAVASGTLTQRDQTVIQGGWCDSTHFGSPYPCPSKPQVRTMPVPDWNALKGQATRWHVKPADASFCSDKPAGSCQTLSGDPPRLDIFGDHAFSQEIIYIDGDLEVPGTANQELVVSGSVTFAVTGTVTLGGNVLCAGGSTCNVGFIAGGDMTLGNKTEVRAMLQTQGSLSGNQITIHGTLVAEDYDLKNGVTLYPPTNNGWPPGVSGGTAAPSGTASSPGGYSDWDQ